MSRQPWPLESCVRLLRQPKKLSSSPAVSQLTLFYDSFIFTLVSYKEETSSSTVEDVLNNILERLDDIFESKSLFS